MRQARSLEFRTATGRHASAWFGGEPGTPREGQVGVERLGNPRDASTKLLYVDGERHSIERRRSILQALHYEVALGESGREVFERLQEDRYNAVIMGHPLSDLETSDLLVGVRRANVSSKILLLSAYPKVHHSLLELTDGFVYKRQPHNEFVSCIEKVLEGRKTRKFPLVRALPRYSVRIPVAVQVLRSGIKETFYGTSNDLSERGIAGAMKAQFTPGELVRLFSSLPNRSEELEA
jgi:CheY-like chemotaxis protein